MDIVTSYQRKVVTSKNFIFISVIVAILIRIALFVFTNDFSSYAYRDSSPLSTFISTFITPNLVLSLVLSIIFTALIALYLSYLNVKYNLIRVRSYLVYSITFLVFSAHPLFLLMSSQYIEVLLFIFCIDVLFSSYQLPLVSNKAYSIGFILAIASLFSIYILFYLILFWIGFFLMRSFNFKSFIASVLGVITIYWFVFSYYLWQKSLQEFIQIFTNISVELGYYFKTLQFAENLALGLSLLFLIIAIFNNLAYAHDDKIKVRAKIAFLDLTVVCSLISCSLINLDQAVDIYIYGVCYSILISHFFAVRVYKWKVYLFFLFIASLLISPAICILFP